MKYQIYLKKDVSETINRIAERENKKSSTLIKQLIESMFNISAQIEKEFLKNGKATK